MMCLEPMSHVLRSCWSSHMVNMATWESMYSLFPVTTLDNRRMVVANVSTHAQLLAYSKYIRRGYQDTPFVDVIDLSEFSNQRAVGDEWTRRVRFSGTEYAQDNYMDFTFKVVQGAIELTGSGRSSFDDDL